MKKLLIAILLIIPLWVHPYWVYAYQMQTQWFYGDNCRGYFSGKQNEGEIFIKIDARTYDQKTFRFYRDTLIQPFIFINYEFGRTSATILMTETKSDFRIAKISHYEIEKMHALNYIKSIEIIVKRGTKTINKILYLSDVTKQDLKELIKYTKPL